MALLFAGTMVTPHFAWLADLTGRNGSQMKGSLEMYAGATTDTTIIELEVRGDRPRAARQWQVGRGTCAAPTAESFGKADGYPTLRIASDGKTKIEARLLTALPDSGDFFVGVYESSDARSRLLSCGNLYLED